MFPFLDEFLLCCSNCDFWNAQGGFVLILITLLSLLSWVSCRLAFNRDRLPPSPLSLPVIGHLHLVKCLSHRGLSKLSEKYGPIIFLRLGPVPTVVVSSATLAKEFLHDHDETFANRPRVEVAERLFYGNSASFLMDYNARCREIRKVYEQVLKRMQLDKQVSDEEISLMLKGIEMHSASTIQLRQVLFEAIGNIMWRVLFSQRVDKRFEIDLLAQVSQLLVAPIIGDFIPHLKWFDPCGYRRKMDSTSQRWDALIEAVIKERLKEMQEGKESPNDMLKALLELKEKIDASDTRIVKAALLELMVCSVETTLNTIQWAMAELLRTATAMKKLQEELDEVVGIGRQVEAADIRKARYLEAVMKETWRLHPPTPLLPPHLAKKEARVGGYKLPRNTRLLVNMWAIGRDGGVWREAEKFRPERFMRGGEAEGKEVKGHDYELMPFGTGRRVCPAMVLGMGTSTVILANLVHSFEWCVPQGSSICMDETVSIVPAPVHPLLTIPTLRHPLPP